MITTYQMFWADLLANIDQQIAHVQSFKIERGDDELLLTVAKVLSDLYDSRDQVTAQLMSRP